MANTGRIPLWLVGLVGGLAVITMLSLFSDKLRDHIQNIDEVTFYDRSKSK